MQQDNIIDSIAPATRWEGRAVTFLRSRPTTACYQVNDVSAVIVSYNSWPELGDCLRSVLDQGLTEVVVVENGDFERTRTMLALVFSQVRCVGDGTNRGYGGGANRGARGCTKPLLLVLNPDVVLMPNTVQRLVDTIVEEDAGAVGPLVLSGDHEVFESARTFPSAIDAGGHAVLGYVWPGNPWTRRYHIQAQLPAETASSVNWVQGSCLLVRLAEFSDMGGFDEAYFMYLEDTDLCRRLVEHGRPVMFEPRAVIRHLGGTSTRRHPVRMALAHHRSALRFWWRSRTGRQRVALPLALLLLALRLLFVLSVSVLVKKPLRMLRSAEPPRKDGNRPAGQTDAFSERVLPARPEGARTEHATLVADGQVRRGG